MIAPVLPPANFAHVDDNLWRGARPTPAQAQYLLSAGVASVINLELFEEDKAAWGDSIIPYVHLADWEPLAMVPAWEDRHVRSVLAAIRDLPKPVFLHCRDGQNRTGIAVGAYRLVERGDPLDFVLAEMVKYRGLWSRADAAYLTSLAARAADFRA